MRFHYIYQCPKCFTTVPGNFREDYNAANGLGIQYNSHVTCVNCGHNCTWDDVAYDVEKHKHWVEVTLHANEARDSAAPVESDAKVFKNKYARVAHIHERFAAVVNQAPKVPAPHMDLIREQFQRELQCNQFLAERVSKQQLDKRDIQKMLRFIDERRRAEQVLPDSPFMVKIRAGLSAVRIQNLDRAIAKAMQNDQHVVERRKPFGKPRLRRNKDKSEKKNENTVMDNLFTVIYLERWKQIKADLLGKEPPQHSPEEVERVVTWMTLFSLIWNIWQVRKAPTVSAVHCVPWVHHITITRTFQHHLCHLTACPDQCVCEHNCLPQ